MSYVLSVCLVFYYLSCSPVMGLNLPLCCSVFLPELRKLEKSPMRLGTVFCQSVS